MNPEAIRDPGMWITMVVLAVFLCALAWAIAKSIYRLCGGRVRPGGLKSAWQRAVDFFFGLG